MADQKLSALIALAGTALAADDLLYVADTSAAQSKSVRADNGLNGLLQIAPVGDLLRKISATSNLRLGADQTTPSTVSDVQIGTSGTNRTALTIQGSPGQAVALLRIGDSTDSSANAGWQFNTSDLLVTQSGNARYISPAVDISYSSFAQKWSTDPTNPFATADLGYARAAVGVFQITDGSSGYGWVLDGGPSRVATNVTNNTATPSAITGLSATLLAGRKYGFELTLKCSNSTATEGLRFDLDGGATTVTSLAGRLSVDEGGTTVLGTVVTSALATDLTVTTATGETWVTIKGGLVCNAGGTLIPRFAESTTAVGTATVFANSTMRLWDIP